RAALPVHRRRGARAPQGPLRPTHLQPPRGQVQPRPLRRMRLVIVGGGPAALATARSYREAGGDGNVTLLTPELTVPYNRPPLSKEFLRGELDDEELPIEAVEWYAANRVTVRLGAQADTLDPAARTVVLGNGEV